MPEFTQYTRSTRLAHLDSLIQFAWRKGGWKHLFYRFWTHRCCINISTSATPAQCEDSLAHLPGVPGDSAVISIHWGVETDATKTHTFCLVFSAQETGKM